MLTICTLAGKRCQVAGDGWDAVCRAIKAAPLDLPPFSASQICLFTTDGIPVMSCDALPSDELLLIIRESAAPTLLEVSPWEVHCIREWLAEEDVDRVSTLLHTRSVFCMMGEPLSIPHMLMLSYVLISNSSLRYLFLSGLTEDHLAVLCGVFVGEHSIQRLVLHDTKWTPYGEDRLIDMLSICSLETCEIRQWSKGKFPVERLLERISPTITTLHLPFEATKRAATLVGELFRDQPRMGMVSLEGLLAYRTWPSTWYITVHCRWEEEIQRAFASQVCIEET